MKKSNGIYNDKLSIEYLDGTFWFYRPWMLDTVDRQRHLYLVFLGIFWWLLSSPLLLYQWLVPIDNNLTKNSATVNAFLLFSFQNINSFS